MQYIQYTIGLTSKPSALALEDAFDYISALLADLGFDSFEHQDEQLVAYIPATADYPSIMADLIANLPSEDWQISHTSELMPDVNWNEEWERNYFQPITIGENLCQIRAPFHEPNPEVKTEVIISPKMAFGTGNHETTALMMSYILEHDMTGLCVLDMGCGTGILGILALKQGAKSLTAIDIDEWAYLNVIENAMLNGVVIEDALQGDASSLATRGPYDLILANITRNILLEDMAAYAQTLAPSGRLVMSGFYEEDAGAIIAHGETLGLRHIATEQRNKWARVELTNQKL